MSTIFVSLNINAKVAWICARLNAMLNNIFNDNKNKYKWLNMFKRVVNNNDKRIRFRSEIE